MDTTSYSKIKEETRIDEKQDGIHVYVPLSWVVDGEMHISYTTIIRLIECCREYHWKKDILAYYPNLDSICGQLDVRFEHPINPETEITVKYKVVDMLKKKYILDFMVFDMAELLCCFARMIIYLYDEDSAKSVLIPDAIKARIVQKE